MISGALSGIKAAFSLSRFVVQVVTRSDTLGALAGSLLAGSLLAGSLVAGALSDGVGRKRAVLLAFAAP